MSVAPGQEAGCYGGRPTCHTSIVCSKRGFLLFCSAWPPTLPVEGVTNQWRTRLSSSDSEPHNLPLCSSGLARGILFLWSRTNIFNDSSTMPVYVAQARLMFSAGVPLLLCCYEPEWKTTKYLYAHSFTKVFFWHVFISDPGGCDLLALPSDYVFVFPASILKLQLIKKYSSLRRV